MAAGLGLEPRYSDSESEVLPLDDPAKNAAFMQRAQFSRLAAVFQRPEEMRPARMRAIRTRSPRELSFRNSLRPTLKLMGMWLLYRGRTHGTVFVEGDGDYCRGRCFISPSKTPVVQCPYGYDDKTRATFKRNSDYRSKGSTGCMGARQGRVLKIAYAESVTAVAHCAQRMGTFRPLTCPPIRSIPTPSSTTRATMRGPCLQYDRYF